MAVVHAARIEPYAQQGAKLQLARGRIERHMREFLARSSHAVVAALRRHMHKAAKDPVDEVIAILYDAIDWESLVPLVEADLKEAYSEGGLLGLAQLDIADSGLFPALNETAADWAAERAAELVGMKWVRGKLVSNPDASFAISETTRDDLRDIIEQAFEQETVFDDLVDEIRQAGAFSDSRATLIANTEIASAQANGNLEAWRQSEVVGAVDWVLAGDHDAEDECDDLSDEGPYAIDDVPDFPAHPACLLAGTFVSSSSRVTAQFKRWFQGEIRIVSLATGDQLAITPNHPMLSRDGWIAAGNVEQGMYLAHCSDPWAFAMAIDPNDNLMPTMIEQVSRSLLKSSGMSSTTVPTSTEDFHGDGITNGKVDIVTSDGLLKDERQFSILQQQRKLQFVQGHWPRLKFKRPRPVAHLGMAKLSTSHSSMSGFDVRHALIRGLSTYNKSLSFARRADSVAAMLKQMSYAATVNAQRVGDVNRRFPRQIAPVQLLRIYILQAISTILHRQIRLAKSSTQPLVIVPYKTSQILDSLSGQISFVQVVDVDKRKFCGHVFNLATTGGHYLANKFIVHNCECALIPAEIDDGA